MSAGDGTTCRECSVRQFTSVAARSSGIYEGSLAPAIVVLNYEQIEPLGTRFAKRVREVFAGMPGKFAADLVAPVPRRRRQKERGFNQVDLFGRRLAQRLGLPYRPVPPKSELPAAGKTSVTFR